LLWSSVISKWQHMYRQGGMVDVGLVGLLEQKPRSAYISLL
jgi:hypothetical protein